MRQIPFDHRVARRKLKSMSEVRNGRRSVLTPLRKCPEIQKRGGMRRRELDRSSHQRLRAFEIVQIRLDVPELEQNAGVVGHPAQHLLELPAGLLCASV